MIDAEELLRRYAAGERDFSGVNLWGANLSGCNLTDIKLEKAELSRTNLSGANLQNANLDQADLEYADLSGANLQGVILWDANLSSTKVQNANFESADCRGASLLTNLSQTNLTGADLRWSKLGNISGANLQKANLETAKLQGCNLQGANLQEANLKFAKMLGANLDNTNLRGANLEYAELLKDWWNDDSESASLHNAIYDKNTVFPRDFEPEEAGAIEFTENYIVYVPYKEGQEWKAEIDSQLPDNVKYIKVRVEATSPETAIEIVGDGCGECETEVDIWNSDYYTVAPMDIWKCQPETEAEVSEKTQLYSEKFTVAKNYHEKYLFSKCGDYFVYVSCSVVKEEEYDHERYYDDEKIYMRVFATSPREAIWQVKAGEGEVEDAWWQDEEDSELYRVSEYGIKTLKVLDEDAYQVIKQYHEGKREFTGLDLSEANLSEANLSGANLTEANLTEANLFKANLTGVNLSGADLCYANLSGANLLDTNLNNANLWRANLTGAICNQGTQFPSVCFDDEDYGANQVKRMWR